MVWPVNPRRAKPRRETAELMDLAPVEQYPVLNSFFSDRSTGTDQTEALRRFVAGVQPKENIVLVALLVIPEEVLPSLMPSVREK